MKKTLLFSILALSLFCTNCEGPMGPMGDPGRNGLNGRDGRDGNANVKTYTFDVYPYQWKKINEYRYGYSNFTYDITQDIVDNGDVRVYIKSSNSGAWQALPYNFNGELNRYWYDLFEIQLDILSEKANAIDIDKSYKYKAVIIEGEAVNKSLDYNDYNQVKEYYGLQDDLK